MPSIKGVYQDRRIILPAVVFASRDALDVSFIECRGLLDTGATASWISKAVVDELGWQAVGRRTVIVATETRIKEIYPFRLGLKGEDQAENAVPIVFAEILGFAIDQPQGFDVLLGMDVLSQTDFAMYRDGRWELSFG